MPASLLAAWRDPKRRACERPEQRALGPANRGAACDALTEDFTPLTDFAPAAISPAGRAEPLRKCFSNNAPKTETRVTAYV